MRRSGPEEDNVEPQVKHLFKLPHTSACLLKSSEGSTAAPEDDALLLLWWCALHPTTIKMNTNRYQCIIILLCALAN